MVTYCANPVKIVHLNPKHTSFNTVSDETEVVVIFADSGQAMTLSLDRLDWNDGFDRGLSDTRIRNIVGRLIAENVELSKWS